MQDVIEKRFGKRPTLFRPPYGNYNQDTLRAAKSCGIKYAPTLERGGLRRPLGVPRVGPGPPPRRHRPHPLPGPRGLEGHHARHGPPLPEQVTAKGYAVARLEDYL